MDLALLEQTLSDRGEPGYRARQVWEWTARGSRSYDDMTTLAKPLRAALAEAVPFSTLEVVTEREARDGTVKVLFRTHDGHPVEAVLMRYRDGRRSLCLSSQSGCPLTCTFCATGRDALRAQPDGIGDPRPGAALPAPGARESRRVHGHGRAVPELRRGARVGAAAPRPRDHASANDDLDRRLDAGPAAVRRRGRAADPPRALDPLGRSRSCARS